MLTRKQYELLLFIHQRIQESGVPPSFDEMKEALDLRSKSGIHRLITALEERGFIRRLPHRARALEVLKLPETNGGTGAKRPAKGFKPSVIQGTGQPERVGLDEASQRPTVAESHVAESRGSGRPDFAGDGDDQDTRPVPLMGRIAAGTPIEALQQESHQVGVPAGLLGRGEHYALEVKGDSMIDAGILDGDTVIIQRSDTATNGEIVVALVDDHEATLKRLRRKGDSVALEAANPAYETRIFGPDRVRVQGRLVGLIRKY